MEYLRSLFAVQSSGNYLAVAWLCIRGVNYQTIALDDASKRQAVAGNEEGDRLSRALNEARWDIDPFFHLAELGGYLSGGDSVEHRDSPQPLHDSTNLLARRK